MTTNEASAIWLGLDKIHRLTVSSSNKLRVDLERFNGETGFAEYSFFSVANETANYSLSLGSYSGKLSNYNLLNESWQLQIYSVQC